MSNLESNDEQPQSLKDRTLEEIYNEIDEGEEALHLLNDNIKELSNYYDAVDKLLDKFYEEIDERKKNICAKEKCPYDCNNDEHCHDKTHRTEETKDKKYCEYVIEIIEDVE